MKLNNLNIILAALIFTAFTSCKDAKDNTETYDNVEAQDEAFDDEMSAARGNDQVLAAVQTDPGLSTFATALHAWNLEDSLETGSANQEAERRIVFAPTNLAYSRIGQNQGEQLLNIEDDEITAYHIVKSQEDMAGLRARIQSSGDTLVVETMQGEDLKLTLDGNNLVLTGVTGESARVTDSLEAGNGMVYIIDKVLLPRDNKREVEISTEG